MTAASCSVVCVMCGCSIMICGLFNRLTSQLGGFRQLLAKKNRGGEGRRRSFVLLQRELSVESPCGETPLSPADGTPALREAMRLPVNARMGSPFRDERG